MAKKSGGPRRALNRRESAAYLSVSENTFDKFVSNGLMPRARLMGARRKAWCVRELDAAFDQFPIDG